MILTLLLLGVAFAAPGTSADACVAVEGDRITTGDLVSVWPALAELPADTCLGYTPVPGAQRVFRVAELKRLAARYGVRLPNASRFCVERPTEKLAAERVAVAMRKVLPDARIQVIQCSRYPVPRGSLDFPPQGISRSGNLAQPGILLWRGFVHYGANHRFAIWARARIAVITPRVVAVEPLHAGKPIAPGQVRLETREALPSSAPGPERLEQVLGKVPLRSLTAGSLVTFAVLSEPPIVQRAQVVDVAFESRSARIMLTAEAMAEGQEGQVIPLRNLHSGKRFYGRVIGPGKVLVNEKGSSK